MDQAVSCRSLAGQARVQFNVTPYWICGRQRSTRTRCVSSTSIFPCNYYETDAPRSFIYHRRYTIPEIDSVVKWCNSGFFINIGL